MSTVFDVNRAFTTSPGKRFVFRRSYAPGSIVESPLPVKNYKSKLWLEVDDEPDRAVIFWQSDFDANGASDEDAKKTITTILADGVKGIKKAAIADWDKRHPEDAAAAASAGDDKDDDDK